MYSSFEPTKDLKVLDQPNMTVRKNNNGEISERGKVTTVVQKRRVNVNGNALMGANLTCIFKF